MILISKKLIFHYIPIYPIAKNWNLYHPFKREYKKQTFVSIFQLKKLSLHDKTKNAKVLEMGLTR